MLTSIVVPLDGSPFSEMALARAADIARRTGARLDLVRVLAPGYRPTMTRNVSPTDATLDQDLRREAVEALGATAQKLTVSGLVVSHAVVEGDVAAEILAHVKKQGAGLVVLATNGRTGLRRLLLGSVAAALVRECPAAVLVVKAREAISTDVVASGDAVLLPFDGSERDYDALDLGATWSALLVPGKLVLLHVVEPVTLPGRGDVDAVDRAALRDQRASAAEYLARLAAELEGSSIKASVQTTPDDDATSGILRVASRVDASLIAMVTRARGGSRLWNPGSVADRVLREGDRDVLLVRERV
ncbi:MAG: universal stress protein [Gemmatimonadaceae bacterium]|nr:universal stress protein [Gemmatimonadaceae bacterium]